MSISDNKKLNGVFIPVGMEFKELTDEIPSGSINAISEHLGYHCDQVFTYFKSGETDEKIMCVVVEIFSGDVVFVLTQSNLASLEADAVKKYLNHFKAENVFDSYIAEDILKKGIGNKSLRIDFLSRVLKLEEPEQDGINHVQSLGLYLYFIDGYLVDFQASDGLNEWAKLWKANISNIFIAYQKVAQIYWGNNINGIIDEINTQADSWARVPQAMNNEYLELHRTKHGTINFSMLLVCHYDYPLSFEQFSAINHGRFISLNPGRYKLDRFEYEFLETGVLKAAHLSEL